MVGLPSKSEKAPPASSMSRRSAARSQGLTLGVRATSPFPSATVVKERESVAEAALVRGDVHEAEKAVPDSRAPDHVERAMQQRPAAERVDGGDVDGLAIQKGAAAAPRHGGGPG